MIQSGYRWAQWGDLNAFFGLMIDNVVNLVILAGILIGVFNFPSEIVMGLMIPGTAVGVLFGDIAYSWLAFRLAKKTGKTDITAMPLGLDTPSTIGMALAVLGPVYLQTKDAVLTWQVGMAALMMIGVLKFVFSFFGDWVRRSIPQAGLLGSLAGIGIALLAFFPIMKIFSAPAAGLVSLGIILYSLVAKHRLPFGIPGAFLAIVVGIIIYNLSSSAGVAASAIDSASTIHSSFPHPTLGFIHGFGKALAYLPIALPFAILTIVGGIDVTESARVAGDNYSTRSILLTEALATMVAALFGGVAQSCPYIGHPAYKAMGGRAAYTLATGLFIGITGSLGIMSHIVKIIPEPVITPILIFVGLEIVSQAFIETPRRHTTAVAFAIVPIIGYLLLIDSNTTIAMLPAGVALPEALTTHHNLLVTIGNGFILTSMLWGGMLAELIEGKFFNAALCTALCSVFSLFGIIHSVMPSGDVYLPWRIGSVTVYEIALGYGLIAAGLFTASVCQKNKSNNKIQRI